MALKKYVADNWADFGNYKVYDHDVANVVRKHLRLIDRFNLDKVVEATNWAFSCMADKDCQGKDPFPKNWKFSFK